MRSEVLNQGITCKTSYEPQLFHETMKNLRNRTEAIPQQTDEAISRLKEKGIEILNAQLDRETLVVWIWCRSQAALEYIQKLYESNQLNKVFMHVANISKSTSEITESMGINIDSNQFRKTVGKFL